MNWYEKVAVGISDYRDSPRSRSLSAKMLPPLIYLSVGTLREDREGWELTTLRAVATNVHFGRCIVAVAVLPQVQAMHLRCGFADVTVELKAKHSAGHVVAELFNLFSDVSKKCVDGPATDHHHDKDGALSKVHGHSSPGADGVGADLVGSDA